MIILYSKNSHFLMIEMEMCNETHTPKYKIIYKPAKGRSYQPEWLVCEQCHEKRIFGTSDDIISITTLD